MKTLTCIVCPAGCSLVADDSGGARNIIVSGNRCPRGAEYAREEVLAPKRVVTATCSIADDSGMGTGAVRRLPVRTSAPCPREKIPDLLDAVYKIKASLPVTAGDILIKNWNGSGIDVTATRSIA